MDGGDVYLHSFLTSALYGDAPLTLGPGRLTPWRETPVPIKQDAGWATVSDWSFGEEIHASNGIRTKVSPASSLASKPNTPALCEASCHPIKHKLVFLPTFQTGDFPVYTVGQSSVG